MLSLFRRCLIGLAVTTAHAIPVPFDLAGPTLEVKVTRGTTTLGLSEVPNLAVGDRIWIKADLPATQSILICWSRLSSADRPTRPRRIGSSNVKRGPPPAAGKA